MERRGKDRPIEEAEVVLHGGPSSLPFSERHRLVTVDADRIKVPYRGGYEHFERVETSTCDDGPRTVSYQWTMRTSVAE